MAHFIHLKQGLYLKLYQYCLRLSYISSIMQEELAPKHSHIHHESFHVKGCVEKRHLSKKKIHYSNEALITFQQPNHKGPSLFRRPALVKACCESAEAQSWQMENHNLSQVTKSSNQRATITESFAFSYIEDFSMRQGSYRVFRSLVSSESGKQHSNLIHMTTRLATQNQHFTHSYCNTFD